MVAPKELQREQVPTIHHQESVMSDEVRQQLAGIQQQLTELRKEVGDAQQQLAQVQAHVYALYCLSQSIGPQHLRGFCQWTRLVHVIFTPWHCLGEARYWATQRVARLRRLKPWPTFYAVLFGLVLLRGRIIRIFKRLSRLY